jgi:hypothetical protein
VKTQKSHQRQLVDGSDLAYKEMDCEVKNPTNGSWWMVQIQPIGPCRRTMKLNSLLNPLGRFVSEAGSEPSTHSRNSRGWDSKTRFVVASRLDLNHPPTPVGGISDSPHG